METEERKFHYFCTKCFKDNFLTALEAFKPEITCQFCNSISCIPSPNIRTRLHAINPNCITCGIKTVLTKDTNDPLMAVAKKQNATRVIQCNKCRQIEEGNITGKENRKYKPKTWHYTPNDTAGWKKYQFKINPHCHWCGKLMELIGPENKTKHNTATIDHIRPVTHPGRFDELKEGEIPIVLACYECNQKRSIQENKKYNKSRTKPIDCTEAIAVRDKITNAMKKYVDVIVDPDGENKPTARKRLFYLARSYLKATNTHRKLAKKRSYENL